MKQYQNKLFLITSVLGIIFFSFISCDVNNNSNGDDSPCGDRLYSNLIGGGMENYAYTDFIVDGNASVSWRVNCQNVCTAEHSNVRVEISVDDPSGISVEATVLYGVLRERSINLTKSIDLFGDYHFFGEDDFGIKDYYGESPGEFTLLLTMYFPSQNSTWSADSMFVANNVEDYSLDAFYNIN